MTQILKTIKSWYGRGNNAWDGTSGLDQDLAHIDNHLGGIKFSGGIATGTAASATPTILGIAKLFADGSYAVTNYDAGGTLIAMAYPAIQGLLASDGYKIYINSGSSWSNPTLASYTGVPTLDVGHLITVTAPHLRQMVWNGTAYVRAPWHQPGMVQYSIDNPASIPGYLPVRGDVVYAQSNYPDLIARLGLSGAGNFSLVELRGEFIRCLDNGRGVDAGRVSGAAQASTLVFGDAYLTGSGYGNAFYDARNNPGENLDSAVTVINGVNAIQLLDFGSPVTQSSSIQKAAIRPRNVALPAWVSY